MAGVPAHDVPRPRRLGDAKHRAADAVQIGVHAGVRPDGGRSRGAVCGIPTVQNPGTSRNSGSEAVRSGERIDSTVEGRQSRGATLRLPVGGDALVLLQNELRIRDPFFPDLIEYVPFIDAGQLWTREQRTNRINLDRLIVTPGFGVRYFSPVGPIQANAGYNPSKTRAGP